MPTLNGNPFDSPPMNNKSPQICESLPEFVDNVIEYQAFFSEHMAKCPKFIPAQIWRFMHRRRPPCYYPPEGGVMRLNYWQPDSVNWWGKRFTGAALLKHKYRVTDGWLEEIPRRQWSKTG